MPAKAPAPDTALDLDTAIGRKGKVNGGVYAASVPRFETQEDHDMVVFRVRKNTIIQQ